jgi:hypothetical protein
MTYFDFEKNINLMTCKEHFTEYRHILPAVNAIFRDRFIATMQAGFNIHEAFDHINNAYRLPEKNYMRYLNYIINNRQVVVAPKPVVELSSDDVIRPLPVLSLFA